jgi:hypothetical protein
MKSLYKIRILLFPLMALVMSASAFVGSDAALKSWGSEHDVFGRKTGSDIDGMVHPAFDVINAGVSALRSDKIGTIASLAAVLSPISSAATKSAFRAADAASALSRTSTKTTRRIVIGEGRKRCQ